MPNLNTDGGYRYAYQGQEKDKETGMEAFELRLWDARIGRWLTTDPAGQCFSPYLGMGNNPINGVDSDGGVFVRGIGITKVQFQALLKRYESILGTAVFNQLQTHPAPITINLKDPGPGLDGLTTATYNNIGDYDSLTADNLMIVDMVGNKKSVFKLHLDFYKNSLGIEAPGVGPIGGYDEAKKRLISQGVGIKAITVEVDPTKPFSLTHGDELGHVVTYIQDPAEALIWDAIEALAKRLNEDVSKGANHFLDNPSGINSMFYEGIIQKTDGDNVISPRHF